MLLRINFFKLLRYYLASILLGWVMILVFGAFKYPDELIYPLNELMLLVFSGLLVLKFNYSYRMGLFSKRIDLYSNRKLLWLKISLTIFIFLMLVMVTFWLNFVIYDYVLDLNANSVFAVFEDKGRSIHWFNSRYNYATGYYFYSLMIEAVIMMAFWFCLSSIIKNPKIMYSIFVVILVYTIAFGNIRTFFISRENGHFVFSEDCRKYFIEFNINLFVFPWNQVGIIGNRAYSNLMIGINFFDYSELTAGFSKFYWIIAWFWSMYVLTYLVIPLMIDRKKRVRLTYY